MVKLKCHKNMLNISCHVASIKSLKCILYDESKNIYFYA